MKKIILITLAIFSLYSCQDDLDDDNCLTEAYKIEVIHTASTAKSTHKDNNLTLTEDTILEGDITAKNVNLNGFELIVIGDLTAHNFIGPGNSTIFGTLTVNQNLNLNNAEVYANTIIVSQNINGPGTIQYCNILQYDKNLNNDPVLIHECKTSENNDEVLDDNNLGYSIETVACELIGTTVDGFKYLEVQ